MLQGYLNIVFPMLLWGSVSVFVRKAGQPPEVAATFRVFFAALALTPIMLLRRGRRPAASKTASGAPLRRILLLALSGFSLGINWVFYFKSMMTTTVANAVISTYVAPVLVALAAPVLLHERLEKRTALATALAFGGLIAMVYEPGHPLGHADLAGIGYGLGAAVFYALVTLTARMLGDFDPARLVWIQTSISVLILAPTVIWADGARAFLVPSRSLLFLAVLGVVHTAFALFLYFRGLLRVRVQHIGVLAYLEPLSSVIFAYLVFHEVPTIATLLGGAVVLGSSALLLGRSPDDSPA
ncbi:MAG: DMT family transporter [Mycobacterium leprae]